MKYRLYLILIALPFWLLILTVASEHWLLHGWEAALDDLRDGRKFFARSWKLGRQLKKTDFSAGP